MTAASAQTPWIPGTSHVRYMHFNGKHYTRDFHPGLGFIATARRTTAIRQWTEDFHSNRFTWWEWK